MIKPFLIVLMVVVLSGCGMFEPRIEYIDKPVPVFTVPEPPMIKRPELPIHYERYSDVEFLSDPNNIGQIVQDYVISLRLMFNYAQSMEEIINTYRDLSKINFENRPNSFSFSVANPNVDVPNISTYNRELLDLLGRANIAFSEIKNKYEERMGEIIRNEVE